MWVFLWWYLTFMEVHWNVQVGGFLQRLDYVRKYAFGVISILKNDEGQFPIRCAPAAAQLSP